MSISAKLYKALIQSKVLNFNVKLTHDCKVNLDAAIFICAGDTCALYKRMGAEKLKAEVSKAVITLVSTRLKNQGLRLNFELRRAVNDFSKIYVEELWLAHWDRNPSQKSFRAMAVSFTQAGRRLSKAA